MNHCPPTPLLLLLLCALLTPSAHAQEASGEDDEKRVQYQLVLPDEKTPENVKPEEHNPFESESEAQNRLAPGDTEENRVRDRLLKLPVVGTVRMPDGGMRVLLGNLKLEIGKTVPPVLPEQLVELKVKNITSQYIELAWQEKRATGLPPKLMIIPINIAPTVRYQMLGQTPEDGETAQGVNATMDLPLRDVAAQPVPPQTSPQSPQPVPAPPRAGFVMDDPPPTAPSITPAPSLAAPASSTPAPAASPPEGTVAPPSPAVESVVRMLFGNPAPAPK